MRVRLGLRVAAVLAVAAPVWLVALPAHAASTPLVIVAVGDSYASGEGAVGTGGWINTACHRSRLAAPAQAATTLGTMSPPGTTFTSLACSGSAIAGGGPTALLGPGGQLAMLPGGIIDALTMSIGGNDIGFAGLVTACLPPFPADDCSNLSTVTSGLTAAFAALPARLDAALAAVPGRVRHVFLTEYPDPTTGLFNVRCGNLFVPGFAGFDGINETEATFASNSVVMPLNTALAAAVARANARGTATRFHLATGVVSRFLSHGYCTGPLSPNPLAIVHPRYIATPVDSLATQLDVMGAMHPNELGQQQIAAALVDAMAFLTQPLNVSVSFAGPPVATVPVGVTVTATTGAGDPALGASVLVDGVPVGTINGAGQFSGSFTFATAGTHRVTVDINPHPTTTRSFTVQGKDYRVTSQPTPIPIGTSINLTITASDTAMNQLVAGTFSIRHGGGTTTLRSGVARTVKLTMRFEYIGETDGNGKPIKSPVCPTITFTPDAPAFVGRSVDELIDCLL